MTVWIEALSEEFGGDRTRTRCYSPRSDSQWINLGWKTAESRLTLPVVAAQNAQLWNCHLHRISCLSSAKHIWIDLKWLLERVARITWTQNVVQVDFGLLVEAAPCVTEGSWKLWFNERNILHRRSLNTTFLLLLLFKRIDYFRIICLFQFLTKHVLRIDWLLHIVFLGDSHKELFSFHSN